MYSCKTIVNLTVLLVVVGAIAADAKLFGRSRYYDESLGGYGNPYASGSTGERAIIRVRGARNPYDGTAPSKIAIEDNPYRGPYPRGVYDRLDVGYNRQRIPIYPQDNYGYSNYNGYGSGRYGGSMYGAPNRIAVTGAYPIGYGSRFA